MQIYAQLALITLQREPENLKREISQNNAKHHKQELVCTSVVKIILITSEQSPEDFCFEISGMGLSK